MDALRVNEHANTKAKDLSGGTKRKVSTWISRIPYTILFSVLCPNHSLLNMIPLHICGIMDFLYTCSIGQSFFLF